MQKKPATDTFFLLYFEDMFITVGDSEMKEGFKIEESAGQSLGRATLAF